MSGRKLRQAVRLALLSGSAEKAAESAASEGLVKGVNALFPCLYDLDERVRWRAVSAFGILVDRLAREDMEAARTIMRRLMWNLNDESGGIGWGSPEAMGEIISRNGALADEYRNILFSYAGEDGNYLELPELQRGLMWAIGRFAGSRPDLVEPSSVPLRRYLASGDAPVRGLAAWVAGILKAEDAADDLRALAEDRERFRFFNGLDILERSVGEAAGEALRRISKPGR